MATGYANVTGRGQMVLLHAAAGLLQGANAIHGALLTGVPMVGELAIPTLLGGGRGVLMGQAISSQFVEAQNYALGSAMAVLVLIAVGVMVALLGRLTRGFAEYSA